MGNHGGPWNLDRLGGAPRFVFELALVDTLLGDDEAMLDICWVSSEGGMILVYFNDRQAMEQSLDAAGVIYGLTPAQLRLVRLIVVGKDLGSRSGKSAAGESGIERRGVVTDKAYVVHARGLCPTLKTRAMREPLPNSRVEGQCANRRNNGGDSGPASHKSAKAHPLHRSARSGAPSWAEYRCDRAG